MANIQHHYFMQPRTIEVSRFPGWKLHVREDMVTGDIQMVAVRASDGKRLEYSEPILSLDDGWRGAIQRLADRLGADFLDLVPIEGPSTSGGSVE